MKAARYDFNIPRGEDWAKTWTFPFNLQNEGWTAELIIGGTVTLKPGSGMTIVGGVITTTMDKVKTAVPTNFHRDPYRLVLINPAGEDATYIKGMATWATQ